MCLADKALLIVLNISQWTGRKKDYGATETVESTYATTGKVGQYTKKLLPECKELDEISRVSAKIRSFFYEQTLPWFSDGSRIISSKNYLDFTNAYCSLKNEFDTAVNSFINVYPTLVTNAQSKLGAMFNAAEYPSESRLVTCFSCDVHFMPMPDVKDFRVEITEQEKQEFTNKMKQVETDAMNECWNRLYEVVNKATSRLQSPDAIIRDSLIENIQDICKLLPKLNVNDDAKLESMRLEVETISAKIDPEMCRTSDFARQDSAKQLQDALNKMNSFMGGVA